MRTLMSLCLVLMASSALAQAVFPSDIRGQPLMYMKDGIVEGCGVRFLIIDIVPGRNVVPVYDMSFNLYRTFAAVKAGSYDVHIDELRAGKPMGTEKRVSLTTAWLKAANTPATTPLNGMHQSDDKGFFLYEADVERVTPLFLAVMRGESISVGARREKDKGDRIFAGPVKLDPAELEQLTQCAAELVSDVGTPTAKPK